MKGKLIVIEGMDGSGKTTLAKELYEFVLSCGKGVILTREPSGTEVGEAVSALLNGLDCVCAEAELLLLQAARAQHIKQVIEPALNGGKHVITDRYTTSTFAYQCAAGGINFGAGHINADLMPTPEPDSYILLDCPASVAFERLVLRGNRLSRIERRGPQYLEHVRNAYLYAAKSHPTKWLVIDATASIVDIREQAESFVFDIIKNDIINPGVPR